MGCQGCLSVTDFSFFPLEEKSVLVPVCPGAFGKPCCSASGRWEGQGEGKGVPLGNGDQCHGASALSVRSPVCLCAVPCRSVLRRAAFWPLNGILQKRGKSGKRSCSGASGAEPVSEQEQRCRLSSELDVTPCSPLISICGFAVRCELRGLEPG